MRPFSKLYGIARNPRRIFLLAILAIIGFGSITYCTIHYKADFTHPQNLTISDYEASGLNNDFARMNYVTKTIPSMKYRDFCAAVLTNVQDIECWTRFYRIELTKIGFQSFDLFNDHTRRLLEIAKLRDAQLISQHEVGALFLDEQDRYAQVLEDRVREETMR